jgi:hypothetical protein
MDRPHLAASRAATGQFKTTILDSPFEQIPGFDGLTQ